SMLRLAGSLCYRFQQERRNSRRRFGIRNRPAQVSLERSPFMRGAKPFSRRQILAAVLAVLVAHQAAPATLYAAHFPGEEALSNRLRALAPEGGALHSAAEWVSDGGTLLLAGTALFHLWRKDSGAGQRAASALAATAAAVYAGKVVTGRARPD